MYRFLLDRLNKHTTRDDDTTERFGDCVWTPQ